MKGNQSLQKALDVIDAVDHGCRHLKDICDQLTDLRQSRRLI
ncbi:hypothetical protein [Endozoicomonas ascidiicola]|nr:hypothetical protein [Endozoicomonas ascidiicola]